MTHAHTCPPNFINSGAIKGTFIHMCCGIKLSGDNIKKHTLPSAGKTHYCLLLWKTNPRNTLVYYLHLCSISYTVGGHYIANVGKLHSVTDG